MIGTKNKYMYIIQWAIMINLGRVHCHDSNLIQLISKDEKYVGTGQKKTDKKPPIKGV